MEPHGHRDISEYAPKKPSSFATSADSPSCGSYLSGPPIFLSAGLQIATKTASRYSTCVNGTPSNPT